MLTTSSQTLHTLYTPDLCQSSTFFSFFSGVGGVTGSLFFELVVSVFFPSLGCVGPSWGGMAGA